MVSEEDRAEQSRHENLRDGGQEASREPLVDARDSFEEAIPPSHFKICFICSVWANIQ